MTDIPTPEAAKITPEQAQQLTPDRAAEVAEVISERWNRDWKLVLEGISARTGLSVSDAMSYYAMSVLNNIQQMLTDMRPPGFHENCEACKRDKEFHEMQMEMMKLTIRHMREEHEDWKDDE